MNQLLNFLILALLLAPPQQSEPARPTPAWVRDGVIYEIFPRVFSPEGNLNGVTERLDDLKDLGVTILWLMPIHPIGHEKKKGSIGSPYAVRDYYGINPDYGTPGDLRRLVSQAHARGMKVIIDIVAGHTSWDSVLMKHPEYYKHDAAGRIIPPEPDWADVAALNYNNRELRRYMIDMIAYWLREFDLDGFRCDAADRVPKEFWEAARLQLEKVKPGLMLLDEAYVPGLVVKAFDLDYGWPLFHRLEDVIDGRAAASALRTEWEKERGAFPSSALHIRFSDDHDERRAIAHFGEQAALAASAFVFTMDGVPLLYNGMEVGDTAESGAPALFERLPIFWPIRERRPQFQRFYKQIIALRRTHPALSRGEIEWLHNGEERRVVTFVRRANNEELLVAINFSNLAFSGVVEVKDSGSFVDITPHDQDASPQAARTQLPTLTLDPWGYRIYHHATR